MRLIDNAENKILFLSYGKDSAEQLEIVLPAFLRYRGQASIVIYSDQLYKCFDEYKELVEIRIVEKCPQVPLGFIQFGSSSFAQLTRLKARIISDALESVQGWVLYCDTDVLPLRPFYDQVDGFMKRSHVFISGEGRSFCPRSYCTGVIGVNCTPVAKKIISAWEDYHSEEIATRPEVHDQVAFDELMMKNPELEVFVDVLPEGVAMPGWYYDFIFPIPLHRPHFFHANWCTGHENKCRRLRNVASLHYYETSKSWRRFAIEYFSVLRQTFQRMRPAWSTLLPRRLGGKRGVSGGAR